MVSQMEVTGNCRFANIVLYNFSPLCNGPLAMQDSKCLFMTSFFSSYSLFFFFFLHCSMTTGNISALCHRTESWWAHLSPLSLLLSCDSVAHGLCLFPPYDWTRAQLASSMLWMAKKVALKTAERQWARMTRGSIMVSCVSVSMKFFLLCLL